MLMSKHSQLCSSIHLPDMPNTAEVSSQQLPAWTRPFVAGLATSSLMTAALAYIGLAQQTGWSNVAFQNWTTKFTNLIPYSFPLATILQPTVRTIVNTMVRPPNSPTLNDDRSKSKHNASPSLPAPCDRLPIRGTP
jgi:hypothetical protein